MHTALNGSLNAVPPAISVTHIDQVVFDESSEEFLLEQWKLAP